MDANGTRFHLLLGEADWSSCVTPSGEPVRSPSGSPPARPQFAWDERTRELTLQPEAFLFTQQTQPQKPVQPDIDRRGVGADRFGNIYWIDETAAEIKVLSADGGVSHFWAAGDGAQCIAAANGAFAPAQAPSPPAPLRLSGLAVTSDHHLVAGVVEPRGLLIFDLYVSGPPQQWLWPPALEFTPFDIAARPQGGVWILDRVRHRVWQLDRLFNVVPHAPPVATPSPVADFASAYPDAETAPAPSAPLFPMTADAALALPDCHPVAIEALPDDSFLILAQPSGATFATIERYRFHAGSLGIASTDVLIDHLSADDRFALTAYDFAVVPLAAGGAPVTATAYVATSDGNQCFAFKLAAADTGPSLDLRAGAEYLPMRLFGGKGLATVQGEPYYDFGPGWVPLKEQKRPRYPEQATLVTSVFDGREPQCVWHRLLIDAVIPPDCTVQVLTRASDDARELADPSAGAPWNPPEPSPYRRGDGSEIAYAEPPTRNHEGTWELLFQSLRGRYAQLKLVITGDQRSTPRLRALRVYYPRFSYLAKYLPAVYREDAASASFLERFLANFEGILTAVEDRIAAAQVLFDVRRAPSATLPWLAGWFGVALDPVWKDDRRRLFIRNAMVFFQWRGTALGLKMALRLALEDCASDAIFDLDAARDEQRFGIRISEGFLERGHGGRWSPSDGETELNRRYRAAIGADNTTRYPLLNPADANEATWRAFSSQMLGFVPAASEEQARWQQFLLARYSDLEALNTAYAAAASDIDQLPMPQNLPPEGARRSDWDLFQAEGIRSPRNLVALWHDFLSRRYPTVQALNDAHGTAWRGFDEAAYPVVLPNSDAALKDWFDFEGTLLAMERSAHRFRVLLPLFAQDQDDQRREQRRALAQRIVELEKPAHTAFEVNYYWAMFLVGTARVGRDTQLDVGSRAPQLAVAAILNSAYLGSSYLATDFPPPGARRVLGVGALGLGAGTGRLQS